MLYWFSKQPNYLYALENTQIKYTQVPKNQLEILNHNRVRRGVVGSVLIRRKAKVRVPGQTSKRNTKSISAAISSQQISGKNS